jgi:DNA-binding NtrC family response regulator
MSALVDRGLFREDLRLALSAAVLRVPALRERPPDIAFLAEHFRVFFARKHGLQVREFSAEGLAALQRYPWPGNVRELQTVIERALLRHPPGPLGPAQLGLAGPAGAPVKGNLFPPPASDLLREAEKRHILAILLRCRGNRTRAARRLGISLRTLRNKLRAYQRNGSGERGA